MKFQPASQQASQPTKLHLFPQQQNTPSKQATSSLFQHHHHLSHSNNNTFSLFLSNVFQLQILLPKSIDRYFVLIK
jgi:hypothetical protein